MTNEYADDVDEILAEQEQEEPEYSPFEHRYDLDRVKFVDGRNENGSAVRLEVTDAHRWQAVMVTESETLTSFKEGLQYVAPGLRRYGRTFSAIVRQFQDALPTIEEEMTRIAHRNLRAIVSRKLNTRRILNFHIAEAEKKARDGVAEKEESVTVPDDDLLAD